MLDSPGLHCMVAERDGELVASLVLQITPNLTRGARPYALIENVVTRSDQRRQGLGKRMLQAALERAYAQGCYKVMLLTGRKDAGVHRFYRDAGFDGDDKHGYVARPPGG